MKWIMNFDTPCTLLQIEEKEEFMYCSTTTGDIVIIRLNLENKSGSTFVVLCHAIKRLPYNLGLTRQPLILRRKYLYSFILHT